jgi:hypothetical protein
MNWFAALDYCESLTLADNTDWRLPNVKELHSIVDYSRSPDTTSSAAIDPLFEVTKIINEGEKIDYPNYWSSTTHQNLKNSKNAAYVAFGRSLGYMNNNWIDVHGAGAQRSDPKAYSGQDYPEGFGPQGDAVRYENYARCVTGGEAELTINPSNDVRETKQYQLTESDVSMDMNQSRGSQKPDIQAFGELNMSAQGKGQGNGPGNRQGQNPMDDLDSNGDGKLSKDEVRGPLQQDFSRLDKNGDGYLTEDELPGPPARR